MGTERRASVLYVEDDPQARDLVEKLIRLKFPDVIVHVAADGQQGLALYMGHRPDIVLTDISMPVLDGIEMSRRIREVRSNAFIIAVTAHTDHAFQTRSKELQFNNIIPKPVRFDELVTSIKSAIDHLFSGN